MLFESTAARSERRAVASARVGPIKSYIENQALCEVSPREGGGGGGGFGTPTFHSWASNTTEIVCSYREYTIHGNSSTSFR